MPKKSSGVWYKQIKSKGLSRLMVASAPLSLRGNNLRWGVNVLKVKTKIKSF